MKRQGNNMEKDGHSSARTAVAIERDGEHHIGSYTIDGGRITVRYQGTCKSIQIEDSPVDSLARLLLAEIVSTHGHLRATRRP
jgi:hypothetical protein